MLLLFGQSEFLSYGFSFIPFSFQKLEIAPLLHFFAPSFELIYFNLGHFIDTIAFQTVQCHKKLCLSTTEGWQIICLVGITTQGQIKIRTF